MINAVILGGFPYSTNRTNSPKPLPPFTKTLFLWSTHTQYTTMTRRYLHPSYIGFLVGHVGKLRPIDDVVTHQVFL